MGRTILFASVGIWPGTGYGKVCRYIAFGLKEKGHRVIVVANQLTRGYLNLNDVIVMPKHYDPFCQDVVFQYYRIFGADCLLTLFDVWTLIDLSNKVRDEGIRWLPYVPIDAPLDETSTPVLEPLKSAYMIIAMSKFGEKELSKFFDNVVYIPHGVDTDIFHPMGNKEKIKKQLGFPEDSFVFGCVAANYSERKDFPHLYRAFRIFLDNLPSDERKRIYLYHHTESHGPMGLSYDIYRLAKKFDIYDNLRIPSVDIRVMPFPEEALAKVYNSFDVFVTACYSEDTRVVTPNGLKYYWELREGDLVYTLNNRGEIELNPIERIYIYKYNGKMIHFKNNQIDLLVTPDHRVYYYSQKIRNRLQVRKAIEFLGKKTRYYIPTTGKWKGIERDYIDLSWQEEALSHDNYDKYIEAMELRKKYGWGARRISKKLKISESTVISWIYLGSKPWGRHKLLPKKIPTDILFELMGWYISEGYVYVSQNNRCVIGFSNKDEKKKLRIANLLKKIGVKPYILEDRVQVENVALGMILLQCGKGAKNKTIPDWVLEYSPKHLIHLFNGLMEGDGSIKGHHVLYYTSSPLLRDKFVELCLKLGYSPRFWKRFNDTRFIVDHWTDPSEDWVISIRRIYNAGSFNPKYHVREVHYNGYVWDITVKNGNLFVERNGIIQVSGNSRGEGFGLPVIEAQACGVPVIAPANSAHVELIEGHGWLVNKFSGWEVPLWNPVQQIYPIVDEYALADAMLDAYEKEDKRKRFAEEAYRFAKKYDWKFVINEFDALFSTLIV